MVSISLLTDEYANLVITTSGENYRTYYDNSRCGRTALAAEQPPKIVTEVMAVWRDTPTMPDPEPLPPLPNIPPAPSLDQRTAALEAAMLAMMGGSANV